MSKRLNILLAIILSVSLALSSCAVKSGADDWRDKIDKMLVSRSVLVHKVLICYFEGMTSSTAYLVRELDEGCVSQFVSLFYNEEIVFTEQEKKVSSANQPYYSVCLINDATEHKNDDGKTVKDDTGTSFVYAVKFYVDKEGYMYVNVEKECVKCFKSNARVDINLVRDYYEKGNNYSEGK